MHSKAKMEVPRLYNIKYLQCHRGISHSWDCAPRGAAIRDGCHKHGLLKMTDKLIFSSLITSNRFTFLIIKYTFSSKFFSSTAYINMQTQVGKKHLTTKAQSNRWQKKTKVTRQPLGVPPDVKLRIYLCRTNERQSCSEPSWRSACLQWAKGAAIRVREPSCLLHSLFLLGAPQHARASPTLQSVFPSSIMHPGNIRPPSVSGQHKRGGGVTTLALSQSHGPCSRDPRPHSNQPSRPLVGRHLSTRVRGDWLRWINTKEEGTEITS